MKCGDCVVWKRENVEKSISSIEELSVCSFNIERGYNRTEQADFLRNNSFDICLLQEVDIGCKRTDSANVFEAIAELSGANCGVFSVEFEELDSPNRTARLSGGGYHGNAILSRFSIVEYGSIVHTKFFDWEIASSSQPRKGTRITVWADIELSPGNIVRVYNSHLENFCGPMERLEQFKEAFDHSNQLKRRCIFGGDLNTLMHGWIRFLPFIYPCRDWLVRFWTSIGSSEASFFDKLLRADPIMRNFEDSFDKETDVTFTNAIGAYSAKLDWLLFDSRAFQILESHIGAKGLSDHLAIWNKVKIL